MSNRTLVTRSFVLFLSLLSFSYAPSFAEEPKGGPPEFKRLKYRNVGPAAGGRVARSAGVPGDPLTYYSATAGGGVWKSIDGGIHWKPIFDDQPASTIGSLAIAPSDPNVIYVGTGEANIRGNVQPGNGIFKSEDAGKTWKHIWKIPGQIGTMIVHPSNPDIAFAAVLGHAFGPNEERGVYRTVDGGKNWQRVLFKDRDTGASDVCFDPKNPRILFAGLWQTRRQPWELTSGGAGSGLYHSRDGGDTWTHLVAPPAPESPEAAKDAPTGEKRCDGLPEGIWGKICLAVAPSDPRRVYAMIEAEKGGLFRSDDGGESWKLINGGAGLRQRAWYFSTITVHPTNPDVIYCPQVALLKSIDGGKSFARVKGPHHGDHHDIWIDPKMPRRIIGSNDGGVDISTDGGENWYAPPLPIAQFYHVHCDNSRPYRVMGNMQDIGSASGPSNSLSSSGIRLSDWYTVGGGETGSAVPDPSDPNIVYAGEYGGIITRYDHRTRQAKNISIYPFDPSGYGAADIRYRFQWTAPIVVSQHNPKEIYHGANVLFRSKDGGKTWEKISGDLTRNDKAKQKWSGGPITGDNTGVEVYGTIFVIAEAPQKAGTIWVGSDDGLVHVTNDSGKTWTKIATGLPEWATINCIEVSPFSAETVYIVAQNYRLDDNKPYLLKTTDGGKTWKSLSDKMPQDVFLRAVREDPKKKGLLYLASERGVAFSTDEGATWKDLKLNLPTVAVTDLVVKNNDLVLSTQGRSIWILDDITPLREWTPAFEKDDMHLFSVLDATRYSYYSTIEERGGTDTFPNPPDGAVIYYSLKAKPKGDLTIEILGADNKVIAKMTSKEEPEEPAEEGDYADKEKKDPLPTEPGLHRVVWDLRHEGAEAIRKAKVDSGDPKAGVVVTSGIYTVKLTADGKSQTKLFEVLPDPRLDPTAKPMAVKDPKAITPPKPGTIAADLEEQEKLALKMRDDITRLTRTVEQMRGVKKQLLDRNTLLKDLDKTEALVKASTDLVAKIDELEERFHNPKAKVVYDILAQKGGAKLYSQLANLYDLTKDGDGAPSQGIKEIYEEQSLLLKKYELEWKLIVADGLAKLNDQAKKADLPAILMPPLEKKTK